MDKVYNEEDTDLDAENAETNLATESLDVGVDGSQKKNAHSKCTKFSIYKNLVVITLSFMCLFAAYTSLEMLQSSLNVAEGLGLIGLTAVYTSKMLSSLFLPSFVFSKLGMKWAIIVAVFGYIAFMAASFHPTWGTVIPASLLLGVGGSNLWAGQLSYVSTLSQQYSTITGMKFSDALSRLFSMFYTIYLTGTVWGNLVSSLVFSYRRSNNVTDGNFTCGTSFCPREETVNPNLLVTDTIQIYTYSGFCLGCGVLAALLMGLLLDNIQPSHPLKTSPKKLLTAVTRQLWTSGYQKLLVPATLYRGLCQGFIAADFNAPLFGITLFVWSPDKDQPYLFYVCVALWALGYSVYASILAPLYSHVFPTKTAQAMSTFEMLQSLGCVMSYGLSSFLCTNVKVIIVIMFTLVSTICVLIVILHEKHMTRTTLK